MNLAFGIAQAAGRINPDSIHFTFMPEQIEGQVRLYVDYELGDTKADDVDTRKIAERAYAELYA
jgi:hypothetical protein